MTTNLGWSCWFAREGPPRAERSAPCGAADGRPLVASAALSLLGFPVVTLGPLGEDAVTVGGRPGEVVLGQEGLDVALYVLELRLDAGIGDDGEVLRVELAGILGHRPVDQLLGGRGLLGRRHDCGCLHVPAE